MPLELPRSQTGKAAAEVARLCAYEAGRVARSHFGSLRRVEMKGRGNVLTEADLESERVILDILRSEYPRHAVLSEETAAETSSDGWLWVVDPLDGSHNFSQGIPHFCVNLALCHDGQPLLGLTYEPLREEEFFATRGGGLIVNGRPARAAATADLKGSVLGMDLGYDDRRAARMLAFLQELWPGVQAVRVMGSAALGLAYAASGRFDLFVHQRLFPWDIAAGIVLVEEGGGAILDRDGGPIGLRSESAVAGAPKVVEEFLRRSEGKPWRE